MDSLLYGTLTIKMLLNGCDGKGIAKTIVSKTCLTKWEAEETVKAWREHNPSLVTTTFAEWRAYAQCI